MQISTYRFNDGGSLDKFRVEKSHRIFVLKSLFESVPKSLSSLMLGCLFSRYDLKAVPFILSKSYNPVSRGVLKTRTSFRQPCDYPFFYNIVKLGSSIELL